MGAIRNAKQARTSKAATPRSKPSKMGRGEYHGAPFQGQKHGHADGKEHAHVDGRNPHAHKTSAERFAERYPQGAPFGGGTRVSKTGHAIPDHTEGGPPANDNGNGPRQWWDRHVWATILVCIIGALALIAIFTDTGEGENVDAPLPEATARHIVYPPVAREPATATPRPTATATATPCPAPTLPYCEKGSVTLTLGDYVPGETPCEEDELFDNVTGECIHVDRIAPPVDGPPDSGPCDAEQGGYTWQGSVEGGYTCVPLSQFSGRSGHIVNGPYRIPYHTAPCLDGESRLDPPFADVPLCVLASDVALLP